MFTRKQVTRHWTCIALSLVTALVAASMLVASVRAADLKPIVLDPSYAHDRFQTTPRDIVREFRAYTVSFDSADGDDGDGQLDISGSDMSTIPAQFVILERCPADMA